MPAVIRAFGWLNRIEGAIEDWFIVVIGTMVLVLMLAQVFFRYVLQVGLGWYTEILMVTYGWCLIMAMASRWRQNRHICYTLVIKMLRGRAQVVVQLVSPVMMLVFAAFIVWYGTIATMGRVATGMVTNYLRLPMYIEYIMFPLFGFLIFTVCVLRIHALLASWHAAAAELPVRPGSTAIEEGL